MVLKIFFEYLKELWYTLLLFSWNKISKEQLTTEREKGNVSMAWGVVWILTIEKIPFPVYITVEWDADLKIVKQ